MNYYYKEKKKKIYKEKLFKEKKFEPKESVEEKVGEQKNTKTSEKIIERVLQKPRNMAYIAAIQKGDEMTKQDCEVLKMAQEHVVELQKQCVKEEEIDKLICSLAKCYISGCEIHTLYGDFIHYGHRVNDGYSLKPISSMSERMKKGYDVYCRYPNCMSVEIYERHICIVDYSGKTTVLTE